MIKIWKSSSDGLVEQDVETVEKGAWIDMTAPTEEEIGRVNLLSGAPLDFLRAALDTEESSRVEIDSLCILALINIPIDCETETRRYKTLPLAIIETPDLTVTVCTEDNRVLRTFSQANAQTFNTTKRARFIFQLLYRSAGFYLKDLRQMNRASDKMEEALRESLRNKELFSLLDLQKGLTYYSISLRSNRVVIDRLLHFIAEDHAVHAIKPGKDDRDLLDDVRVEYDQAIEMAQIQTEVLAGMMDAFASVISNNLNVVMKFLASVTIVMSIPTIVSGFFGMNVPMPWGDNPFGFWLIMIVAFALAGTAIVALWKKNLF